ncbi:MAG: DUF2085 domain-containing protein [Clostridiales bacterium]|nr:DUF2085 domain-containing protein [Clostridiales bacterium]
MENQVTQKNNVASRRDQRWIFWMEFCGKYARCHQMPERSFFLGSYQFPLCARCTGIMLGRVLAVLLFPFVLLPMKTALLVLPILMLPLPIDGITQRFTKYESNNLKRVITGILWGFATFTLVFTGIVYFVTKAHMM